MKKLLSLVFCTLIIISFSVTAFAYDYSGNGRTALINDFADLISQDDANTLNNKLEQLSELYSCEVAILTVNSTDGKDITEFADDYYDYNGFGYGDNDDGIMLVVDMGGREFAITTHGTAIDIFTDYNLSQVENAFVGELSAGNYTNAFIAFYESCEKIFIDYEYYQNNYDGGYVYFPDDDGVTSDDYYDNNDNSGNGIAEIFSLKWIIISVVTGIIIAVIYTSVLQSQLKTVKSKPSASDYVVPGSVQITQQRDVFMYRDVKKTPKPKNNTSTGRSGGSSFGGSSSTHRSSSGRTHGGSRGSF